MGSAAPRPDGHRLEGCGQAIHARFPGALSCTILFYFYFCFSSIAAAPAGRGRGSVGAVGDPRSSEVEIEVVKAFSTFQTCWKDSPCPGL